MAYTNRESSQLDMEHRSSIVNKAIDLDRIDLLNQHGSALLEKQSYEEALATFNRVIALHPDSYAAWYGRGDAQANLKQYEDALASFNRALELVPDSHAAWTFRGVVLIHLEQYQAALTSCDRAIALNFSDREAWTFRGVAQQRLGDYQNAYVSYRHVTGTQLPWWQRLIQMTKRLFQWLGRRP